MKLVLIFLGLVVSNFSFAGGFQCKDDQRVADGVLRMLTVREDAGKYTVSYIEAGEGRTDSLEEQITFVKNANCNFSEAFVGVCGESETNHYAYVKVKKVGNSVVTHATISDSGKTVTKEIWFETRDCFSL